MAITSNENGEHDSQVFKCFQFCCKILQRNVIC